MDLGPPQVHRFLKAFEAKGPGAIRHKARSRVSNNRTGPAVREYALMLLRERYPDFGLTLAAEKLAENLGLKVSRKTLRKWMIADGI